MSYFIYFNTIRVEFILVIVYSFVITFTWMLWLVRC